MNQWNGTIGNQTVQFRGTSTVDVKPTSPNFPNVRCIGNAVYVARVSGGISGSFGVTVLGRVGEFAGSTVALAGITGIAAVGTYVLFPYGYSASGVGSLNDSPILAQRIDNVVPPSHVAFQSGIATAGISATINVAACLSVY